MNVVLRMPEAEQRLRHEKHYKYVSTHNVAYWTRSFDSDLQHACKDHFSRLHWGIGFGMSFKVVALGPNFRRLSVEHIVPSYRRTENQLIVLDYDSTVMPENSIDRTPSSEVISVLNRLCEDPKNRVFIVSERGKDELSRWFTPLREAGHRGGARLLHKVKIFVQCSTSEVLLVVRSVPPLLCLDLGSYCSRFGPQNIMVTN
jgi:trehalose 6-phosphate synthase/phosphatase